MKVIFTGGGTAGHITPALAMIEELKRQSCSAEILFIGRENGKENDAVVNAGIETRFIKIMGFERRLTLSNAKRLWLALRALKKAKMIIKEFKPDVIIGTGGYVCWPVLREGQRLGIPTVIHESNSQPGLTVKLLSKKCDKILVSTEEAAKKIKHPCCKVTGTPTLRAFSAISRRAAREKLGITENEVFILSFGGSIGAEKINETVFSVMKKYSEKEARLKHLHATGRRYYREMTLSEIPMRKNCKVVPYIDDMPTYLAAADIVISRSGALTLSEISVTGTPAILIPSPNVTGDHQLKNARAFEKRGAAILIEETELEPETLFKKIKHLAISVNERKRMSAAVKGIEKANAAQLAVSEIIKLTKEYAKKQAQL